mgnify:CR=1 FL=1
MPIGVSTACLYPLETEAALRALGECGVRSTEVFLNSWSELSPDFCKELIRVRDAYAMKVVSLHPFTSGIESYMLFSGYERRFNDCRDIYRRYFETAACLGAKYVVLHGDRAGNDLPPEEYVGRFLTLDGDAREAGVCLLQENVNKYRASAPDFIRRLRTLSDDRISFVFDLKQSIRSGYGPEAIWDAMGGRVAHVHISDNDSGHDCLLPGKGDFDFGAFFSARVGREPVENFMIEVYRNAFLEPSELKKAADWLNCKLHAVIK